MIKPNFREAFRDRHIGPDKASANEMLQAIGVDSLDQLIEQTIPANIRRQDRLNLPAALTEPEMIAELKKIAGENQVFRSFLGMGYYGTHVPGVILRNILENPGWYTQYTPYQAEIAQGRLEALMLFQTLVTDLTGMEIANASLLDEATSAAAAMHMLHAVRPKQQGNIFFVSDKVLPQTIDVLAMRAEPIGIELVVGDEKTYTFSEAVFGVLLQYPDVLGGIGDYRSFAESLHQKGVLLAVAADLLALTLIEGPGHWGADVVVGTAQRFGVPMGYGGPHAAYFATRDEFKREMPGRLIGLSVDAAGQRAYRMALQTREQHIRREKATSNICTAQVLLAIMSGMYAVYHGPEGLKNIARRTAAFAHIFADRLKAAGLQLATEGFFDTVFVKTDTAAVRQKAEAKRINLNCFFDGMAGAAFDETTTAADVADLLEIFTGNRPDVADLLKAARNWQPDLPVRRETPFLQHPVFNSFHSEHDMLRYIKQLESRDLSLAHSMIPLGSCTMKLNATTEMQPVTWPEFGNIHPFAPQEQAMGYLRMINELEAFLSEITGFAATSLQPNSGAQGEYAGLMVIRQWHRSRGQGQRNIALIPQSAHGTNPASAVMAGMKVIVVKTDPYGNIDVADLRAKAEQHKNDLSCLMVTYPSTHGVFEESIREICQIVHDNGGQVYMDGANMNAQVGLTSPALIGADVCHLNLHKTFCIPHGGGGPGMGPICVASHLAPFLPGHRYTHDNRQALNPVSAAPFGSASILLISYTYIRLMGPEGLTDATRYAILNANYLKARLEPYYNVLYTGIQGRVAHEMILDLRKFKQTHGVEVEDVAKRLIDYGFHAPTVSFPVAGTLMIEPTESEPKAELDRFCEAMVSIRKEIDEIELGLADKYDNVLKNAPHTAAMVTTDEWTHQYSRQKAAFPAPYVRERKFWPAVARVNNTYGDRNLMCVCPPMEEYENEAAA